MGEWLMLADDFTGAADAGVQMNKNGIQAYITFRAEDVKDEKSYVLDTESRNIPEREAYRKVKQALETLQKLNFKNYYKKIDSTLRGNICSELQAAMEVLEPELVVFNPANPDSARTVIDGTLMMNGVRVMETEIIRDPLCLVMEDNLQKLIEKEMQIPVTHFSLSQIREGKMEAGQARVLTFDVLDNQDFDRAVAYISSLGKKTLWVGSAGLINALTKASAVKYPVLGLVGSISNTSRVQVVSAVEAGAKLVEMNIADILEGGSLDSTVGEAVERLKMGQDVIVVSAREHEDYLEAVEAGKRQGMTRQEVAKFTQEKLGEVSAKILEKAKVCGCVLTGGDTAISVNNKNHAHGARLIEEVLPIVALIELDGGDYPGLPCIVKGGSIGDRNTITEAIRFLKQRRK